MDQYTSLTLNGKLHTREHLLRMASAYNSEIAVSGWEKSLFDFIAEWLSDSVFIDVQTSGSTDNPRNLKIEKDKMISGALKTGEYFNLNEGDKALLGLPLNFIAGKMMVVRAFVLGLDLIPVKPSSNPLIDLDLDIDFAAMTPMQVQVILDSTQGIAKLNRIKKLIIGGGEINPNLENKLQTFSNEIWHTYGMAETLTHVAIRNLTGDKKDNHFYALPGTSFSQDHQGCLQINAPWLSDHIILTNDLVELIDEYTFSFRGRIDNVINSGGIKISPEELESKLSDIFASRYIIAGLHDELLGQKVVLIIEGKDVPENDIREKLSLVELQKHEQPREIYFMYHFPQTESGKVIRRQVVKHFLDH